jgi:hypothetical protein
LVGTDAWIDANEMHGDTRHARPMEIETRKVQMPMEPVFAIWVLRTATLARRHSLLAAQRGPRRYDASKHSHGRDVDGVFLQGFDFDRRSGV